MTELEAKRRVEKSPLRAFIPASPNIPGVSDTVWTKSLTEKEFQENLASIKDLVTDPRISYDSETIRSGNGGSLNSGTGERAEIVNSERSE